MPIHRGFTLPELVIVLVLTGILAVVAIPRMSDPGGFAARGARDYVASGLRYAQKSAVAMRRNVCVNVGASALAVTYATAGGSGQPCAPGNTLPNPATGQPFASTNYEQGASVSTPTSITFDALGRPSSAASIGVAGHPTPISVEAESGYVH
ncbi:MAG TPA: GspH/FimT family pseudopilin [Albitalea sp.]